MYFEVENNIDPVTLDCGEQRLQRENRKAPGGHRRTDAAQASSLKGLGHLPIKRRVRGIERTSRI